MSKKKPFYVKFDTPEEIVKLASQALEVVRENGKLKRGTNETTKAIERNLAKLVLIAEDVDPPEVVAHLPELCDERKIPYLYVPTKIDLGKLSGIEVPSAAICVTEAGEAEGIIGDIASKLKQSRK